MKVGKLLGIVIVCFNCAFGAETTNEHPNKIGAIFEELLKRAVTNLTTTNVTSSATNAPDSISTNVISRGGTNAPVNPVAAAAIASIPTDQLTAGLRQALSNGLTHAVATLGRTNGFLTNLNVRITLPSQLARFDKTLRQLGQGALVDEFEATMNHAAEQAVPVATGVFIGAVSQMTIADARNLLASESKTAATEYFRRTTTNQLTPQFLPIVKEATAKSGVTAAYKNLLEKIPFNRAFFSNGSLDLDDYVTAKALDGLFILVADEEKRIRENPQARVTTLLEKVFGALQKAKASDGQ